MEEEEERSADTSLYSILNEMRLDGALCDVVLKVEDAEFQAHKNILSVYSPFFRSLFTTWSSMDQRAYPITTIPANILDLIIRYIYTKELLVTIEEAIDLLDAAQYLLIQSLSYDCCKFLVDHLRPENCLEIWHHASARSHNELSQKALVYVLHHFEEVLQASSGRLMELSAEQLGNILEKDELNIKQEKRAFEALMSWIQHDREARKQHLVDLLMKVRLALLPAEYFLEILEQNQLLSGVPECQPILTLAMKVLYFSHMTHPVIRPLHALNRPRLPYYILFATGGFWGPAPTNIIEIYDSKLDYWMRIPNMERKARAYHGTVYLGGFMYVVGGYNRREYFNTMSKFNPCDGTWSEAAPMHSPRCYVSVALLDDHIYAMGGFNGRLRLNTAERYNPNTNQWSLIASMHERRSDANATALKGKIYICGGFNGNECTDTVECFHPEYNQWTYIAPMHLPRGGLGVICFNDQLLAVAGSDGLNRLQSIEIYNPRINSWRMLTSMFNPRSNFGIEVIDGCLYVIGGFNGEETTSNCEGYDFNTDTWFSIQDMNITRSALSCCVISGLPNITDYTYPRNFFI